MFKKAAVLVVSCGALLTGCGAEQSENDQIISNLIEAGYKAEDMRIVDGKVIVQDDAEVSLLASQEMLQKAGPDEQYRTNNLVDNSVSKICVIPTAGFESYSRLSAGLDDAIAAYNAQGLRLTFARGSASDCDATITAKTMSGVGGSAGFPKGGNPYGTINIGTGLQSYSAGVNAHVIMHELGHCIGFRHSDYYNRAISCGSGGNEGSAGVGAVHIPGTPTTATSGGSVMNSCFRSNESGSWSSSDRTALNYLY